MRLSPEKKLYYDLACIFEEFSAEKDKRVPDYKSMPSVWKNIVETSSDGQKYYIGVFYTIVREIWTDCLGMPLCDRRKGRSVSHVGNLTRERMDSSAFGNRVRSGIIEGQKLVPDD
ncbi:hypothetical protein JCM14713_31920 [Desulfomicrobium salsuginis]